MLEISAEKSRLIVSTVPDVTTSLSLLSFLRVKNFKGTVIVTAQTHKEAHHCYALGAAYVIVPRILGAEKFRELFVQNQSAKKAWKQLILAK